MLPHLESYRNKVDHELALAIDRLGEPSRLRDACAYACLNGGKRLRPILVLLIAEALPKKRDIISAALCVEYFHAASLIADDLPCMDNDDMRRSKPSLHKVYEESIAILASYTLIAAGYGGIYETARILKQKEPQEASSVDAASISCLQAVTRCAGLQGATHGQYLDLFMTEPTYEAIRLVIERKTATLFEISFLLGWLFGGGSEERLSEVRQCAIHLGVAFQIADDLQDVLQDGKATGGANLAGILGLEKAVSLFQEEFDGFVTSLKNLGLWTTPFQKICKALESGVKTPV
jgi:geranylgeranyl diphosphate synthase type II